MADCVKLRHTSYIPLVTVCLEPCGMFNMSRSSHLFPNQGSLSWPVLYGLTANLLSYGVFVPVDTRRWCLFGDGQTQMFSRPSYSMENTTHQLDRQWGGGFCHNPKHFLFPVWLTFLSQTLNLGLCEMVCFGLLLAPLD